MVTVPSLTVEKDARAWTSVDPPLEDWILEAISAQGFQRQTPVQAATIGCFSKNKDVVVEAVTGSGKTLAYLLPLISKVLRADVPRKHHVNAIVIAPTRELATQIHNVLIDLLKFHAPSFAALNPAPAPEDGDEAKADERSKVSPNARRIIPQLLLGGTTTPAQDLSHFLKQSPNVLIATPGRLLELLSSPHVHANSSFEVLVLDEADRLLDLGFKDDLQRILSRLPKQRRTGLFSASVSEAVGEIIRVGLRNPVKIVVKVRSASGRDQKSPMSLQMSYLITPPRHKLPTLFKLLTSLEPTPSKTIVYFSTCAAVDYYTSLLTPVLPSAFSLVALHGKMPPTVRNRNFNRFVATTSPQLLLTTDVAARGLDIPQVDLVIQLDPPSDPKVYLHRCGRAGRAGRRGLAVIFLHPGREEDYIPFLEIRKTPVLPFTSAPISITASEASNTIDKMRKQVFRDRALHDKGQRAFVSWVKSYSKHQASSIFRIDDLQWSELGDAWALVKLPKMPELKSWQGDKSLGVSLNLKEFAYADKKREKARQEALTKEEEERDNGIAGDNVKRKRDKEKERLPWSAKKSEQDVKEARREKKRRKKDAERFAAMTPEQQKEEEKLRKMIELVRRQTQEKEETFEGFGD